MTNVSFAMFTLIITLQITSYKSQHDLWQWLRSRSANNTWQCLTIPTLPSKSKTGQLSYLSSTSRFKLHQWHCWLLSLKISRNWLTSFRFSVMVHSFHEEEFLAWKITKVKNLNQIKCTLAGYLSVIWFWFELTGIYGKDSDLIIQIVLNEPIDEISTWPWFSQWNWTWQIER